MLKLLSEGPPAASAGGRRPGLVGST